MKRLNKLTSLFGVLLTLVLVLAGSRSVGAVSSSVSINREGVIASLIGENYKWAKFRTSDGNVAYCLDVEKDWPTKTTSMTLNGEAQAAIRFILENGYPNKSQYMTDNNDVNRFITQGAIWTYLAQTGQGKLSDDFKNGKEAYKGIKDKINALVAAAKGAKANSKPSVEVNASGTTMSLSSDKKHYVSSEIAPTVKVAGTYKVTVSGVNGAVATTPAGETKSEYKAGEKFIVKVPASSLKDTVKLTVDVTASAKVKKAYIFKPAESKIQRVVSLYDENETAKSTVTLTVTPKKVVCDKDTAGKGEFIDKRWDEKAQACCDKDDYNEEKKTCEKICTKETAGKGDYKDLVWDEETKVCKKACTKETAGKDEYKGYTWNEETKKCVKTKVCVVYVIVGNVKPDPSKTDPTPGKNCYDDGTKYNQEKELTTRQENCTFKGWNTNSNLTGKWVNGTALHNDLTLYGAWDCGTPISVPATDANVSLIVLGTGLAIAATGAGVYYYRNKKVSLNK